MPSRIERITFPGGSGEPLAARLDLPAGPATAFALFAHCFTCGKDLRAATRIAATLTDLGFGVLRFDFTGLGSSEGEFANTNLTSNVDDLAAAAGWLRQHHRAPSLLVGHSLGGAATLVVASQLAEVQAVATIGAPSDAGHVMKLFDRSLDEIAATGEATVDIAGRPFTVRRQLIDDLRSQLVLERVGELHRPLLVLHSPIDNVVGVEHAGRIFAAARHPRSFVSLDGADHLLSREADAIDAATIIGAWASRYVDDGSGAAPPPPATSQVVVAETTQGAFLNHVVAGQHRFLADEPVSIGGFDAGPSPYDLLAAALGACTSMTVRMYADRKELPLERVTVEVTHEKVHADDASGAASGAGSPRLDLFRRVLHLEGDLDGAAIDRLRSIADRCPVHRTLEASSRIETVLGSPAGGEGS
jgi:putative redox protein